MLTRRLEQTVMMQEDATRNRMDLAIAAWLGFLDSPFLGVGFENFRHVAGRYVPGAQHDPHNLWLHLLVHVGLVGTAAFAVLIGGWFLVLLRVRQTTADRSERQLITAFIASMSAILTIHMFVPLILQRPYWLVYGLGLATALVLDEGRRQAPVSCWSASSGETPLKSGTSWERTG
jgi:O-antigen ligase